MQNKVIVIQKTEGGCSIMLPTPEALQQMTIEEIAERDAKGQPWRICDCDTLPQDWSYMDAWVFNPETGTSITIDFEKAKTIYLDNLRIKRDDMLAKLDIEFSQALEPMLVKIAEQLELNDDPAVKTCLDIITKRKELRNVSNDFQLSASQLLK